MQNRNSTNPQGIDISSYQDGLDMSAVKAAGISVVYIKATENLSYVNPYLHEQYSQAKAQGLKVGFYHYFIAGFDASKQAQHFMNAIAGLSYDCRPALDVEETGGYSALSLSKGAKACLDEIQTLSGHQPLLYTYTSFAKTSLVGSYVNAYPPGRRACGPGNQRLSGGRQREQVFRPGFGRQYAKCYGSSPDRAGQRCQSPYRIARKPLHHSPNQ